MNQWIDILTNREWFLFILASVTYIVLFVVAVQNSRRKVLLLQERLNKVHAMKEEQLANSKQSIEQNLEKIAQLETLIQKLGDENSMLRLELEEKKARLDYANTMAKIDHEKREQAETVIFGSDIYARVNMLLTQGRSMTDQDFSQLAQLVNSVYANFTERLYSLYKLNTQEYRVSLLVKARVQPKDMATLTAHSKESVASTRSRLYQKVFGKKGSSKDWDDFILSL
ncbi:MAG: hypothetical protein IKX24_01150 [Prevotella sp.]|nr:hypothetical protein [Prevotella sp.]MBR5060731.1 hypothetical protein [Prevotella sp.]